MAERFWRRYLDVFDRVRIIARAARVDQPPAGWQLVNGDGISFHAVPDYRGPVGLLRNFISVKASLRSAATMRGAVILRVASQVANMLDGQLYKVGRPYGLEVLGDPAEVFAAGVIDHPLRPLLRWHFSRKMRLQCLRASGVAYVTRRVLQERYPSRRLSTSFSDVDLSQDALAKSAYSTSYSSIELDSSGYVASPRSAKPHGPWTLSTVGSMAQMYKGIDVLLRALASCTSSGFDVRAVIVGEGKFRPELMALAERLGISSRTQFLGQLTAGEPVRRILDTADLFVLPSRTEGLPRALIEAMARALPCIGSDVGGIPELLEQEELVPAGDSAALAAKIQEVLRDTRRMEMMSHRNLAVAREYCDFVLAERRRQFYFYIKDCTMRWEKQHTC
ncbi:MAG: glycosyltransferase [Bryobacteraceae bacterium]